MEQQNEDGNRPESVMGPDQTAMTREDLPDTNTKRWVIRRKAQVVMAVRGGLLTLDEACRMYALSIEEFLAWQEAIDRNGLAGLRVTRAQQYRRQQG
ncbi:CtrA inhibitor SciP [Yunchengibacter salinarum]|uniref:CtrA inhibitor SciP n=1 Tax=Yunchengibacter salinarum TaxID=3133399 RepID=UPI0035B576E3